VTIGIFDGIHLGHRQIIQKLKEKAAKSNGETVVVTLWPHPRVVLKRDNRHVELLTTFEEKERMIGELGVDHLVILPFTKEFANITFSEFIRNYLAGGIGSKHIIVGYNHHFGKDRMGGFEQLKESAAVYGFTLERLNPVIIDDTVVSSSNIRNLISKGNLKLGNSLLGYPYSFTGKVIEGKKIGRKIGFPTANLELTDKNKLVPFTGVYAVGVLIGNHTHTGMLNIGIRPTITDQNHRLTIEVHIFNFNDTIYGHEIRIQFLERIRDEQKFNSVDELIHQLELDKIKTQSLLQQFTV